MWPRQGRRLTGSRGVGTWRDVVSSTPAKPKRGRSRQQGEGPEGPANAEALLARLDQVVRELETGELPLEQALAHFEEGVRLVRDGERLLGSVEQRIEMLLADDRVAEFETTREDDEDDD
jgi:exodeoxyribonuclease VII small subunit